MSSKKKKNLYDSMISLLTYLFIFIFLLIYLFPVLWCLLTSLKNDMDLWAYPPLLIFEPTFKYYSKILAEGLFLKSCLNSLLIASSSTIITILFGSLAAYAFSRFIFTGKNSLFIGILSIRMIPYISIIIPLFILIKDLGMINTYQGLILPYSALGLPFAVWIMTAYFEGIPREIDDSALVDGCSRFGAFLKVMLPLAKPGLITVSIINFMACWNDLLLAIVITGEETRTLPALVAGARGLLGIEWQRLSALAILAIIPAIIFALLLQKYIQRGLVMGAVKG